MAPRDFDVCGKMAKIKFQDDDDDEGTVQVHYDLIEQYHRSPSRAWFQTLRSEESDEDSDTLVIESVYLDDDTIVAFVRWLYTGSVEDRVTYFDTVADVLKMADDIFLRDECLDHRFHNALVDHAIGMTIDTKRDLILLDSINAILDHAKTPEHGIGMFLVDWVLYSECEIASIYTHIQLRLAHKEDFQRAISMQLLDDKGEGRRGQGILPWNEDQCRYHFSCYPDDACVKRTPGIAYQSRAPPKAREGPKKRRASREAGEDVDVSEKKKRKKDNKAGSGGEREPVE